MANINESMQLSETVTVSVNPSLPGVDPYVGKAVVHCLACGKVLCDPYPVAGPKPEMTPCHGEEFTREDYAPSVRIDGAKFKATGERFAVAGEPMDHVRARVEQG